MVETERPDAAFFADREERTLRIPAAFLVQIAASHAGIGPFASRGRETPLAGTRRYREAMARRLVRKLLRSA